MPMRWKPATFILLVVAALMVGVALWRDRPPKFIPIEALTGFQDADSPLFLPEDGRPRRGLHALSPWQLAEVPVALRFDAPAGSEHGALTYAAAGRIRGIGGGGTDLGDPVFAAGDGLVLFAGESESGGKCVILAHRDREGRLLRSSYEPLGRVDVAVGMLVARGKRIGAIGTEGLDFRLSHESVPVEVAAVTGPDDLSPSPLEVALNPESEPWTRLEIQGADKLGEILEK